MGSGESKPIDDTSNLQTDYQDFKNIKLNEPYPDWFKQIKLVRSAARSETSEPSLLEPAPAHRVVTEDLRRMALECGKRCFYSYSEDPEKI